MAVTRREPRDGKATVEKKSRKFRAWDFWKIRHIVRGLNRRFEIEELVAQDSFRVVYRALDRNSGRLVAVRRLLPGGRGGEGYDTKEADAFGASVRALSELECPGLRHPVAWGVDPVDRLPFVASEWVEGDTLATFLEHGALSAEAGRLLAQRALAAQVAVDTTGHGWQIDTSVESVVVAKNDESFQFSFWVAPFPGGSASIAMVKDLTSLIERAMGWHGRMPSPGAGEGLANWLRLVRQHRMDATDAQHVLSETHQQSSSGARGPEFDPTAKPTPPPTPTPALPDVPGPKPPSMKALGAALILLLLIALGGGWWLWRQIPQDPSGPANHLPGPGAGPAHLRTPAETASARAVELAKMADSQENIADADDDRVFGPSDGTLLRSFIGRDVTFEGVLRNVRDSTSGKTRYLEFSKDRGIDDVCGHIWTKSADSEGLSTNVLKSLTGRKLALSGKVQIESGTGRVVIHITKRKQITEPKPGE